jgi:hypothetical protein
MNPDATRSQEYLYWLVPAVISDRVSYAVSSQNFLLVVLNMASYKSGVALNSGR